jgi:hypothetical protein
MPTDIREQQLSFVAYAFWRFRIWVAGYCFGASLFLANWGARLARLSHDLQV